METENKTEKEMTAYYHCLIDAYEQLHPLRTKIFKSVLKHIYSTLKEDTTLFYLMEQIQYQHIINSKED